MKKLEYVNESDFKSTTFEFSDDMYTLADDLHKNISPYTPVMTNKNGDELFFGVSLAKNKVEYEIGDSLYKVTITKMNRPK